MHNFLADVNSPLKNRSVGESEAFGRASRGENAGELGDSSSFRDADAQAKGPLAARMGFSTAC